MAQETEAKKGFWWNVGAVGLGSLLATATVKAGALTATKVKELMAKKD